jgi:hypothetical protein
VPLLRRNDSDQTQEIALTAVVPTGWKEVRGTARYPVKGHSVYPIGVDSIAPLTSSPEWQILTWNAGMKAGQLVCVASFRGGFSVRPKSRNLDERIANLSV